MRRRRGAGGGSRPPKGWRWRATWSAPASPASNGRAMRRRDALKAGAVGRDAGGRGAAAHRPARDRRAGGRRQARRAGSVAAVRARHLRRARRGAGGRHRRLEPRHAPPDRLPLRRRDAGRQPDRRAQGTTGLLLVIGGSQTRIGSHRMYERLAKSLAENGYPCFRFDRRGVGDSERRGSGLRGQRARSQAAAAAFRGECPALTRLVGFGLCDGATALACSATRPGSTA